MSRPAHHFGDGVLDLDAGIDLDEIEFAGIGIDAEFDRAGAHIIGPRGRSSAPPRTRPGGLQRRDRARARARLLSGCGAGSSSRAQRDAPDCRACRPESAPRHGGRGAPIFRDRPRPCRRRPWPRAWRCTTASSKLVLAFDWAHAAAAAAPGRLEHHADSRSRAPGASLRLGSSGKGGVAGITGTPQRHRQIARLDLVAEIAHGLRATGR